MNLYKFHDKPKTLHKHDVAHSEVFEVLSDLIYTPEHKFNAEQLKGIANDCELAYAYATEVTKGPWPPGEKIISTDYMFAFYYAKDIIKGPWPPGEEAIAASHEVSIAYEYAHLAVKGRWPMGENLIMSNTYYKHKYERMIRRMDRKKQ